MPSEAEWSVTTVVSAFMLMQRVLLPNSKRRLQQQGARQTRFALRPLVPGTLHGLGLGGVSGCASLQFGRRVDRSHIEREWNRGIGSFFCTRPRCQPFHFFHPFLQHAVRHIAMQLRYWLFEIQAGVGQTGVCQHSQQAGKMPARLMSCFKPPRTPPSGGSCIWI